jgi:non-ribosomal peptide synthetase component F
MSMAKYRDVKIGGCLGATAEMRADGSLVLRSTEALGGYPARLTDRLEHWAAVAPDRVFAARRGADGAWVTVSYAQMLERARRLGQALATRGLSAERPIAILSDNDLEHLTFAGARERWGDQLEDAAVERLVYELKVIQDMGFSSYFLIVWDLIAHARRAGMQHRRLPAQ